MQSLNINTVIFRFLISCGIAVSSLYAIQVLPASAQSSADEQIECIKKFRNYYYSREGGNLMADNALAKAEQTCTQESNQNPDERIECIKKFRNYYYSREGGNLMADNALAKAEQTCTQESKKNNQQPVPVLLIPTNNIPSFGGSPQAITDCMKRLMYERKLVCTRSGFPGCSHFPTEGFGGWEMQDVRTELSDATVVQACQNAR